MKIKGLRWWIISLIGLATVGLREGHFPGPCLVWSASEREHRGATCVALEGGS